MGATLTIYHAFEPGRDVRYIGDRPEYRKFRGLVGRVVSVDRRIVDGVPTEQYRVRMLLDFFGRYEDIEVGRLDLEAARIPLELGQYVRYIGEDRKYRMYRGWTGQIVHLSYVNDGRGPKAIYRVDMIDANDRLHTIHVEGHELEVTEDGL